MYPGTVRQLTSCFAILASALSLPERLFAQTRTRFCVNKGGISEGSRRSRIHRRAENPQNILSGEEVCSNSDSWKLGLEAARRMLGEQDSPSTTTRKKSCIEILFGRDPTFPSRHSSINTFQAKCSSGFHARDLESLRFSSASSPSGSFSCEKVGQYNP